MGDIADMMINGELDEETGEYIGHLNKARYGTTSPGFPVSYERDMRTRQNHKRQRVSCPICGKRVKKAGLEMHIRDVHGESQVEEFKEQIEQLKV